MSHGKAGTAASVRLGLAITLLGGFLFTFELPLLRLAHADAWTLLFARGLFLFVSITVGWYAVRAYKGIQAPFIVGKAGLAVIATNTIAIITYVNAIKLTAAANVVFITALIPIATALMAWLLLNERVHAWTWLATILSFFGIGLIVADSLARGNPLGDFLAVISCLCTAACFTIVRASGKNVATSIGVGSLVAGLIALPFAAPATLTLDGWLWVALAGLVVIPLASTLLSNGPRFLPSADVSMFFLLETALTPVWVYLLFGEMPTRNVLIGGLIVIATLATHSFWRLKLTFAAATGKP